MRKRVRIALAVLLVVIAGVIGWQVLREREPVYEEKALSVWLGGYAFPDLRKSNTFVVRFNGSTYFWHVGPRTGSNTVVLTGNGVDFLPAPVRGQPEQDKSDNAMSQIGTNAIPTLLRMLKARNSVLTIKVMQLAQRQRIIKFKPYTPAWVQNLEAATAFERLNVEAREAVPSLVEIYEQNISLASKIYTASSLGSIGTAAKQAVPALLRGAAETNMGVRFTAVEALGKIRAQPELVVPALIKYLHDGFGPVRVNAASALGGFGAEARGAVPALLELLTDADNNVREQAAGALKEIDPGAAAKAGVK